MHNLGFFVQRAAQRAWRLAQDALGIYYANGERVAKNLTAAVKWFRNAAEQGNLLAQGCLGNSYRSDQGVTRDNAQAAKWDLMGANLGDSMSHYNLGWYYINGYPLSPPVIVSGLRTIGVG